MNIDRPVVEAVAAKDQEVEGSQATAVAHATTVEDLWVRQQCVAKVEIRTQDQHHQVWKTKIQKSLGRYRR